MAVFLAAALLGLLGLCKASGESAVCEASGFLQPEDVQRFWWNGYIILRGMFSQEEVAMLQQTLSADPAIEGKTMPMSDANGRTSKLTLWNKALNNTYGHFARGERWVRAAEALIGEKPYHFHTKVMLKEPRQGGSWEWHQDFGYWYQVGCLEPDLMFSSILAVDQHTKENGCMQLLARTHRLGRLPHGSTGEQAGADVDMVKEAKRRFPLVHAEMRPGDVLFTHSNLLHASAPNLSPDWRRSLIVAYNAVSNPPRPGTICPLPSEAPLEPIFSDDSILNYGPSGHKEDEDPVFMSHDDNAKQFTQGDGDQA